MAGSRERVFLMGKAGGREFAIAQKLLETPPSTLETIFVAPGSDGIKYVLGGQDHRIQCVPLSKISEWKTFGHENGVTMGIVGPEAPIVEGAVDELAKVGIPVIAPDKKAARLEASKSFTKEVCWELGIPTAEYLATSDPDIAKKFVKSLPYLVVVKADGLCGGKGVTVCDSQEDAFKAIDEALVEKKFKEAGEKIVIERRLYGKEFSFFFVTDGETIVPLPSAEDRKRRDDGDTDEGKGPMTGGVASCSPSKEMDEKLFNKIMNRIVIPLIEGLKSRYGITYKGPGYIGGMAVANGNEIDPMVLEFNDRLGDPEAQVILPRLDVDLIELFKLVRDGRLHEMLSLKASSDHYFALVATSGKTQKPDGTWCEGYPGSYATGIPIFGLENIGNGADVNHAGTKFNKETGQWVTDGGRVLSVIGPGKTREEARKLVYSEMEKVIFDGKNHRKSA